jgi:MFS family permease
LGSTLVGQAIGKYGIKHVLGTELFIIALSMFLLPLWVVVKAWFLLRIIMGIGFVAIFAAVETLINRISMAENREKNLGLYGFVFSS